MSQQGNTGTTQTTGMGWGVEQQHWENEKKNKPKGVLSGIYSFVTGSGGKNTRKNKHAKSHKKHNKKHNKSHKKHNKKHNKSHKKHNKKHNKSHKSRK